MLCYSKSLWNSRCSVVTGAIRGYVASAHIYSFDYDEAIRIVAGVESVIRDRHYAEGCGTQLGSLGGEHRAARLENCVKHAAVSIRFI